MGPAHAKQILCSCHGGSCEMTQPFGAPGSGTAHCARQAVSLAGIRSASSRFSSTRTNPPVHWRPHFRFAPRLRRFHSHQLCGFHACVKVTGTGATHFQDESRCRMEMLCAAAEGGDGKGEKMSQTGHERGAVGRKNDGLITL